MPQRRGDRMKVLIISADGYEDSELLVPYYRFLEEGLQVDIASMNKGSIAGKHGYEVAVTRTLAEVRPEDYDILVLPGGRGYRPGLLREGQAGRRNRPRAAAVDHRGAAEGQARHLLPDRCRGTEGGRRDLRGQGSGR